jgi:lipid A 3-O-deacylase
MGDIRNIKASAIRSVQQQRHHGGWKGLITIKKQRTKTGFLNTIPAAIVCVAALAGGAYAGPATTERSADTNDGFRIGEALVNLLPAPPRNSTFRVYWENDGTYVKPIMRTDRHYTDGLKLVYTHQPEWDWLKDFARWNNFGDGEANVSTAVGYFFGQNMYTPDHADDPAARREHDRVFAGWMYGGIFAQRATQKEMEHFELNLGIIGPSAGGSKMQTFVHNVIHQEEPNGWENQLDDEFAIDCTWLKRQRADGLLFRRAPDFDSHLEYGFTAGSLHRNANLGVIFRWGDNLPNDFGPGRLEAPDCATGPIGDKQTYLYLFSRASIKVVQYDRFLTGLDEEPVVGQFQLGVAWRYKSFEVSYSQTFLTREYREQPQADSIGALNLSCYF